jgi:hypothetical protein
MINLQVLRVLATYHLPKLAHKKADMKAILAEIANLGVVQNREIAQEICLLLY